MGLVSLTAKHGNSLLSVNAWRSRAVEESVLQGACSAARREHSPLGEENCQGRALMKLI